MNEDIIIKKLDDHDVRLDVITNKLTDHDVRLEVITNKLTDHDVRLDRITDKLLEHDDRLEELGKQISREVGGLREEFLRGQDQMMKILIRLDEERVFTVEAIRRMQDELDQQKKKINEHDVLLSRIKLDLKLA